MPDVVVATEAGVGLPRMHQPLEGAVAGPAGLRVVAAPPMARLSLRGDRAALGRACGIELPDTPCRATTAGPVSALWLGPDEWLLLAPHGTADLPARVEGAAVVDIGHRQVGLVVEGPGAAALLATGCPLDLHPTAFPAGMCTRTVFAKAEIVLWRPREGERFHIEVWRSFAPYVHERLSNAARELGAEG